MFRHCVRSLDTTFSGTAGSQILGSLDENETMVLILVAFRDHATSQVFKTWPEKFRNGQVIMEDDFGPPLTSKTDVKVTKLRKRKGSVTI